MNIKEGGILFIVSLLVSFLVFLYSDNRRVERKFDLLNETVITNSIVIESHSKEISKVVLKLDKSEYENDQKYESRLRKLELEKLEVQIENIKNENNDHENKDGVK